MMKILKITIIYLRLIIIKLIWKIILKIKISLMIKEIINILVSILLLFFILFLDNDNTSISVKNKKRKYSYDGNIDSLIDISVYENNEIFELNMHLFDKFIEYIDYKIKCYNYIIKYVKKEKYNLNYDIKKLSQDYNILLNIKYIILNNK